MSDAPMPDKLWAGQYTNDHGHDVNEWNEDGSYIDTGMKEYIRIDLLEPAPDNAMRDAVKTCEAFVREFFHAQDNGANWYTKGASGLFQQTRMWATKARDAINLLLNALPVWQPIATAPKDGTRIIGWCKEWSAPQSVQFYSDMIGWAQDDQRRFRCQPTLWMPLPKPPSGE